MLNEWNPGWREDRRKGSALPEKLRETANRAMKFETLLNELPERFLAALQIEPTPANISKAKTHCDAYFAFQVNRLRASVIGNYDFEKNTNDFHDWMQLLYLARPSFCYVTDDGPWLERIRQSGQRPRVMSLREFLEGGRMPSAGSSGAQPLRKAQKD